MPTFGQRISLSVTAHMSIYVGVFVLTFFLCREVDRARAQRPEAGAAKKAANNAPFLALVPEDEYLPRKSKTTIPRILRGTEPLEGTNQKIFTDYFLKYYFAEMTDPDELELLPKRRDDLAEQFERARTQLDVTEYLNKLTTDMMVSIIRGPARVQLQSGKVEYVVLRGGRVYLLDGTEVPQNVIKQRGPSDKDFHPAVKYNAMLILGSLNDKIGPGGKDPVPRLAVFRPLLSIAAQSSWSDSLRVGALVGVKRQVAYDAKTGGQRLQPGLVSEAMLSILKEKPPSGREEGHLWIQRQAIDTLATLGYSGSDGEVIDALASIIANDSKPMSLRTAASEALGTIKLPGEPKAGASNLAKQLAAMAVEACYTEVQSFTGTEKTMSRKRLLDRLDAVSTGLIGPSEATEPAGLVSVADAGQRSSLDQLAKAISKLKDEAKNLETPDDKLVESIRAAASQLAANLNTSPKSAPAPGAATTPGDAEAIFGGGGAEAAPAPKGAATSNTEPPATAPATEKAVPAF